MIHMAFENGNKLIPTPIFLKPWSPERNEVIIISQCNASLHQFYWNVLHNFFFFVERGHKLETFFTTFESMNIYAEQGGKSV